ncbi:unnamed protein product, partial [Medioppia subpectinata]
MNTEISSESSGDSECVDTIDEVMATEDNDSQTWAQVIEDLDFNQMMNKLIEIKIFCQTIDKMQCILNTNYSVLNETIESLNHLDFNQTIDCKTFKISDHLITYYKTNDKYFHCLCTDCEYKSKNKNNLLSHQLIHSNIKQFKCDFNDCNESFKTTSNLFRHKKCVHLKEKRFKCNEENCGKSFTLKSNLIQHQCIHSVEKPFVCDFNGCNERYNRKTQLLHHKNSMHLNQRFICDVNDCHKKFTTKQTLILHKRCFHLKEKLFKCNEENCGKSFGQKKFLMQHKRRHSGEKPFFISTQKWLSFGE